MNMFNIKKFSAFISLIILQLYVVAQDTTTVAVANSTNSTITDELWYMQKWVWIAGGAVLLLIIIALLSGGGRKNRSTTERVIITKTVETESAKN